MDLSALSAYFKRKSQPMTLSAADPNLPREFQNFIATMPNRQVTLSAGDGDIKLQGSMLTVSGATSDVWPVQGMQKVSVTLTSITITVDNSSASPIIHGTARGSLAVNAAVNMLVTVTALQQNYGPWHIKLAEDADGISASELLLLGKEWPLLFDIPANLDLFDRALTVNPDGFQITFFPNTSREVQYALQLNAPQARWTLIDNVLSLNGIDLIAFISTNSMSAVILGHILIGGIAADVGVGLNVGEDWRAFIKPTHGEAFPGLTALASWIGGGALASDVASGFDNVNFDAGGFDVAIKAISVGFNWKIPKLNYLDIISLLKVGALRLDVVLRLPDLTLIGSLHDRAVKVKDILSSFGLPVDDFSDNLHITSATFEAQLRDGYYSAAMTIDNVWQIGIVKLEEVSLSIYYFGPSRLHEVKSHTRAEIAAILRIGDYGVGLLGVYETNEGWTLEGSVSRDEDRPELSQVDNNIEKTFPTAEANKPSIPPFLTSWYLQELSARFTTKKKNLDLGLKIRNTALPWLDLTFGIHLIHSDTTYTKAFDALANITTSAFDVDFQVEIEEVSTPGPPASSTFTLSATYQSTKPPHLSDLLTWLSSVAHTDVKLPAELDIDVTPDGFAVKVVQKDQHPPVVEAASAFSLHVADSTWNLYFAYTNATSLTRGGPPVLVNGQPAYVFGVALGRVIDLSKLPLVGKIGGVSGLRIDNLGFYYTNALLSAGEQLYFRVPEIGDPGKLAPNATEASLARSGFNLTANFGEETSNTAPYGAMQLPVATGESTPGQASNFAGNQSIPQAPVYWLDINKTFGPVSLQKIGLSYGRASEPDHQLGAVYFDIDGSFQISGLTMALDRLGIGFNVPKPQTSFDPIRDIRFHLGGLFLEYKSPSLQISGGFITLSDSGLNFIGEFTVMAGPYGLQAYGGFSDQHGDPSLFIFLHLEVPLGGPPFFFVRGLAAGFGINRRFQLPTFDQLTNYPFLPNSSVIPLPSRLGGNPQAKLTTMTQALTNLGQYVPVHEGDHWFAVGLDVSSFEMIKVSAVLSIGFGVDFQVGLVGAAAMTIPVNEPQPIAFVQVNFEGEFSPANGTIAVLGKITPSSFLYGGFVHLSGGFAFCFWFKGANSGNFVMSLGGYNPHYKKPSIYPDVPRLQATFGISSLDAYGEAYFALVPHAMMAGLMVHATWSLGSVSAWFDANLDFLLNWKPFQYRADGYIYLGASFSLDLLFATVHITVHIGIDLAIWGPTFGGRAVVDLDVISFTIHFGGQPEKKELDWSGFSEFLPSVNGDVPHTGTEQALGRDEKGNKPLINISVAQGLLKAFNTGERPDDLDWLIDANGFELVTGSTAPCTDLVFNSQKSLRSFSDFIDPTNIASGIQTAISHKQTAPYFAYKPGADGVSWDSLSFGIPPLHLQQIHSVHTVAIHAIDHEGNLGAEIEDLIVMLETQSYSAALWGNSTVSAASLGPGNELMKDALAGVRIVPVLWFPKRTTFISYYYFVFDTNTLFLQQEVLPGINTTPFSNATEIYADVDDGSAFIKTKEVRAGIVDILRQAGFESLRLSGDANLNGSQYTGHPLLAYMSSTDETNLAR